MSQVYLKNTIVFVLGTHFFLQILEKLNKYYKNA